jgi:predicted acyltransferase
MAAPVPAPAARLASLDIFRGATIAGMILVNNAGDWQNTYSPLLHAEWHGWTPTDLVFPFFLWIMGVAMVYSFAARRAKGESPETLVKHVARRAGILFALGLFLNGFPCYDLSTLRIFGVLQRIGLCYLIAGFLVLAGQGRGIVLSIIGLLGGYWALMMLVPVPGHGAGILAPEGNFAQYVDVSLFNGHLYKPRWDPEGLVSTLPAIANTLFGVLCGVLLRDDSTVHEKLRSMATFGAALVLAGLLWDNWLPINKNLWTSSYALFTSGLAFWALAACYWLADVMGWRRGLKPFEVFGVNAIAAYVLSGLLARAVTLLKWKAPLYNAVFAPVGPPQMASLLWALANVAAVYLVVWLMHRRGWMIRI